MHLRGCVQDRSTTVKVVRRVRVRVRVRVHERV